uniref:Uncharacterized protein n=1 Tax=Arundo donax TaxID=35708 RepID=A0A0A9H0J5_ARUDO
MKSMPFIIFYLKHQILSGQYTD